MKLLLTSLLCTAGMAYASSAAVQEFKNLVATQNFSGAMRVWDDKFPGALHRRNALQEMFGMTDPMSLSSNKAQELEMALAAVPKIIFDGMSVSEDWRKFLMSSSLASRTGGVMYYAAPVRSKSIAAKPTSGTYAILPPEPKTTPAKKLPEPTSSAPAYLPPSYDTSAAHGTKAAEIAPPPAYDAPSAPEAPKFLSGATQQKPSTPAAKPSSGTPTPPGGPAGEPEEASETSEPSDWE